MSVNYHAYKNLLLKVEELERREAKLTLVVNRTKEILDRHGVIYKSSETYDWIKATLSELGV